MPVPAQPRLFVPAGGGAVPADHPRPAGRAWTPPFAGAARDPASGVPLLLLDGLNDRQRAAVRQLHGPLLVVAGPGSGKTRVLTHRIAALLAAGTPPWAILAVTFTNKAAGEMRDRLAGLVGAAADGMWVATFHSACLRILRANAAAAGLPKTFGIVDAGDAEKVLKAVLADLGVSADDARGWHSRISYAKNRRLGPSELAGTGRPDDAVLAEVLARYDARLAEMGAVDFDDLLLRTLTLLESDAEVRDRYQRRFAHVLVDEYQDTNAVQYALLRLLAASGNVCAIGDPDQSVYAWRGATPDAVESFSADWPDATVVVLDQNYRSTKAILETCQAIIDPNPAPHRARLWTANGPGAPVRLYVAADDRDEAAWVVSQIARSPDPGRHAVLFRTNAQSRVFEEALTRAGVAYQVVGALRFYDRAEVKDALAYLRVVANPHDAVSFARCANTPRRGVGPATVAAVVAAARETGRDLISTLRAGLADGRFGGRAAKPLAGLADALEVVATAAAAGPAAALGAVAGDVGLRAALAARDRDRVENLDELVAAARFVDSGSPADPDGRDVASLPGWDQTLAFLESVALVAAADDTAAPGRVWLLTAHAAKGKEFAHVWVVGVEDGLYPHGRSAGDPASLAEERRLLFVAASRAEQTLTLSRCERRFQFGEARQNPPSPFLADLPAGVETVGGAGRARPSGGIPGRRAGRPALPAAGARPRRPGRPAPAGPRLSPGELAVGVTVVHDSFGAGRVVGVDDETVEVRFADRTRVLLLAFAPLRRAG